MPVNRNALIRYRTIDKCLQNRYRKWTINDLVEACSDALYEYEGLDSGVSLRTVQGDLQMLRSDKLGYNAPIVVKDRKYYSYEDENYSITNIPLTDQDLGRLTEAVEFMKQFQGFSHFKELDGIVQKLEDHIYSAKTKQQPVVEIEKNDNLKGLEHLDMLYKAIIKKQTLSITYQSFRARKAATFLFHAYLLKEYRNRWFLVGCMHNKKAVLFLALDRMEKLEYSEEPYQENEDFDPDNFFRHAIGVSVSPAMPVQRVVLWVNQYHAPYVITKPLHSSQQILKRDNFGTTFSLKVQHNFELEKEILAFGEAMRVLEPEKLKRQLQSRISGALDLYKTELSETGLKTLSRQIVHKGFGILSQVLTNRDLRRIGTILQKHFSGELKELSCNEDLLANCPELASALRVQNIEILVSSLAEKAKLIAIGYCDGSQPYFDAQQWQQTVEFGGIHLNELELQNCFVIRIYLDNTIESNGILEVLPGSHKNLLKPEQIDTISNNTFGTGLMVQKGGLVVYKPLLLIKNPSTKNGGKNRTIELWFQSNLKGNFAE